MDGDSVVYGDGGNFDGVNIGPLVSIDTVRHEWTHGLISFEINKFPRIGEGGAINESFADIFGTAVEFYSGINPDFLIGEDWYTPGQPGDAARNMADPTRTILGGPQPDHYKKLIYPATEQNT